jgi:hypothetical protein
VNDISGVCGGCESRLHRPTHTHKHLQTFIPNTYLNTHTYYPESRADVNAVSWNRRIPKTEYFESSQASNSILLEKIFRTAL